MIDLTAREYAILRGLASGLSMDQIAGRMSRSVATIYRDVDRLRGKLGAATIPQLIDRAWRVGVLCPTTELLPHEKPLPAPISIAYPPAVIRERRRVLAEALQGYRRPQAGRRSA